MIILQVRAEYARTGRFPDDSRLKAYQKVVSSMERHVDFLSKTGELLYGKSPLTGQERNQLFNLLYDESALNEFFGKSSQPDNIAANQRSVLAEELFRNHKEALAQADANEFIPLCCWGLSRNVTPDMFVVLQKRGMPPNEINALLERGLRLGQDQKGLLLRKVLVSLWESVLDKKNEGLPDSLDPRFQEMLISSGAQLNRILFGSRRYGRLNNPDNPNKAKELGRVNYVLDNAAENSPLWILKCVEKSKDGRGHDLFANLQQARTDLAKAPAAGGSGSAS